MKFNEDDLLVSRLWRLVVVEQLVSVHSLECPITLYLKAFVKCKIKKGKLLHDSEKKEAGARKSRKNIQI